MDLEGEAGRGAQSLTSASPHHHPVLQATASPGPLFSALVTLKKHWKATVSPLGHFQDTVHCDAPSHTASKSKWEKSLKGCVSGTANVSAPQQILVKHLSPGTFVAPKGDGHTWPYCVARDRV